MKKNLIIYAHPESHGHGFEILTRVQDQIRDRGHEYLLIDLYKEQYNPVLKDDELYTVGHRAIAPDTKKYQELISAADTLIFIFPVWWGQMPAILKGFVDRTFTPGFAFKYRKLIGPIYIPHGFFKHKRSVVFMTEGSPWYFYLFGVARSPKKVIKRMIFDVVGLKVKFFELQGATNLQANIARIPQLVNNGLTWLFR